MKKTGRMIKEERKTESRGESQKKEEFQEEDIYEIECSPRLRIQNWRSHANLFVAKYTPNGK